MLDASLEVRRKRFAELSAATPEGVQRRARLQKVVERTAHEFHGVEVEMNQRYESIAVYLADKGLRPRGPEGPVLEHKITTFPGSRLPHAWLNTRVLGKKFLVISLAGGGKFCLRVSKVRGGRVRRRWLGRV